MRTFSLCVAPCLLSWLVLANPARPPAAPVADEGQLPPGWTAASPRDEIRPGFAFDPAGGPKKGGAFVITADDREGLHGWFQKTFPVDRRQALPVPRGPEGARTSPVPRRSAVGAHPVAGRQRQVGADERAAGEGLPQRASPGPPRPNTRPTRRTDADGWTEVSDTYRAPAKATRAVVELHLLWAPGGQGRVGDVSLDRGARPGAAKVRLATVHFRPSGKSPQANCEEFAPLIAEAAKQKADLVVLGETLTYVGTRQELRGLRRADPRAVDRRTSASWRRSTTCTSSPACSSATGTSSTTSRC